MMHIRERYQKDPLFASMVDTMMAFIEQGNTTPTEIREAAMLAQIMYEERNLRPVIFTRDDVMRNKV